MKRFFLLLTALCCCLASPGAEPDAGRIDIDPSQGKVAADDKFTITFPAAMVAEGEIDAAGHACPFVSEPKLPGTFLWKSQTEGTFTVGQPLQPGATYRLSLAPGLKDLGGNPVEAKDWGASFDTEPFRVETGDELNREALEAHARFSLTANYEVSFEEAAEHVYFQDRDSFKRYPVEVIPKNWDEKKLSGLEFDVAPRADLPVGRSYDLVVNGLTDLQTHHPLAYLNVLRAGKTVPLSVKWLGAFNDALDKPVIRAKFNDRIAPDAATPANFDVEPPVKNLKLSAGDDEIVAEGDFDVLQRYTVTLSPALKGSAGYGLAAPSKWGATFKPKAAAVIFPIDEKILQRSRPGLRFSFLQVNTALLTWNVAEIPLEKLAAVTARIHEFQDQAKDPLTGNPIIDPATGREKTVETELLVKAFDLNIVASGRFDSTGGDKEVLRKIDWNPDGTPLHGPFLLEVFGFGDDGKFVGNHVIVCFSDILMTQKRSGSTVTLRLARMSDGAPVANASVRAITKENYELAHATSNADGLAFFTSDRLFPKGKGFKTHLFYAETPEGPAIQFADGSSYSSGSPGRGRKETVLRSFILPDRNLYRPGQTAKLKGFVRREWGGELFEPSDLKVEWWITRVDADEHVAEGSAALKAGGWDAEWPIPAKAPLGEYVLHCKVGTLTAEEHDHIKVEEYRVPLFSVAVEPQGGVGSRSSVKVSSAYFHGAPNAGSRIHWKATWSIVDNESEEGIRRGDTYSEGAPSDPFPEDREGDAVLDHDGVATLASDAPFAQAALFGRFEVNWRVDVSSPDGQTLTAGARDRLQAVPALPGVRCVAQFPGRIKVDVDAVGPKDEPVSQLPVRVDLFHLTDKTVKEQLAPFVFRYRNTSIFQKVASQTTKTPGTILFPVKDTGEYVATATGADSKTPLVSDQTALSGNEEAEFPVENEVNFKLTPLDKKPFYRPGDTATFSVQAPFGGTAWVTVEAEEILDSLLVPLSGNSGLISLPIRKEYAPNAWVSVYILHPGGGAGPAKGAFRVRAHHRAAARARTDPHSHPHGGDRAAGRHRPRRGDRNVPGEAGSVRRPHRLRRR